MMSNDRICPWAAGDPLDAAYHNERWCVPTHDENELFAMLILEGMQAGLSWHLILKREADIRALCEGLDPKKVASFDDAKLAELKQDPRMIRSSAKIRAMRENAKCFLEVQKEWGSFDAYIWHFTDGKVVDHHLQEGDPLPAKDALSEEVSRDLKKRGFRFAGPVIIYSYLEGIGVINDHLVTCPYHDRT